MSLPVPATISYSHQIPRNFVGDGETYDQDRQIQTLPGSGLIGYGYDVLQYYADSRSLGSTNLFQFPEETELVVVGTRTFSKPKAITYHTSIGTDLSVTSGSNLQEFTQDMNSLTRIEGGFKFFAGSVETEFGMSTAHSSEYEFTNVKNLVRLFTLQLPAHHVRMLKQSVRDDIDTMSDLNRLFNKYNTHYLAGLVMGGVANYTSSTSRTRFQSSTHIGVVAQMSYRALVGSLSAEQQLTYDREIRSFNEASDIRLRTSGGDPGLAGENFPSNVEEWSKSVIDYMAFVDFLGPRSLIGIWELASTEKRRNEIRDFYLSPVQAKYIPKHANLGLPVIEGDWYYLGQTDGGKYHLVVRDDRSGVLADVEHWRTNNIGFGGSLWRGTAANPTMYHVLGDFFELESSSPPTAREVGRIKAIRKDCLALGMGGGTINLGARVATHVVVGDHNGMLDEDLGHYFVERGPFPETMYVLKKSAVRILK